MQCSRFLNSWSYIRKWGIIAQILRWKVKLQNKTILQNRMKPELSLHFLEKWLATVGFLQFGLSKGFVKVFLDFTLRPMLCDATRRYVLNIKTGSKILKLMKAFCFKIFVLNTIVPTISYVDIKVDKGNKRKIQMADFSVRMRNFSCLIFGPC